MLWQAGVLALAALLVQRRNVSRTSDKPPAVPPGAPPVGKFTQAATYLVECGGVYAAYGALVGYALSLVKSIPADMVQALQDVANPKLSYAETMSSGIVTQKGQLVTILWTLYGGAATARARTQIRVEYPAGADPVSVVESSKFYRALKAGEKLEISLESLGVPLSGKATRAGAVTLLT